MKNVRLIQKDESAVSPVIATILMVAITVVLAAVLYVMVSGLITAPGGQVRSIGINPGSAGNNYTMLFTSVPPGLGKTSTFVLVRSPTGAITCQKTALVTGTTPLAGTSVNCLGIWYSQVSSITDTTNQNVEVQDTLLIFKTRYLSGSSIEVSDAQGILAKQTL